MTRLSDSMRAAADRAPVDEVDVTTSSAAARVRRRRAAARDRQRPGRRRRGAILVAGVVGSGGLEDRRDRVRLRPAAEARRSRRLPAMRLFCRATRWGLCGYQPSTPTFPRPPTVLAHVGSTSGPTLIRAPRLTVNPHRDAVRADVRAGSEPGAFMVLWDGSSSAPPGTRVNPRSALGAAPRSPRTADRPRQLLGRLSPALRQYELVASRTSTLGDQPAPTTGPTVAQPTRRRTRRSMPDRARGGRLDLRRPRSRLRCRCGTSGRWRRGERSSRATQRRRPGPSPRRDRRPPRRRAPPDRVSKPSTSPSGRRGRRTRSAPTSAQSPSRRSPTAS